MKEALRHMPIGSNNVYVNAVGTPTPRLEEFFVYQLLHCVKNKIIVSF